MRTGHSRSKIGMVLARSWQDRRGNGVKSAITGLKIFPVLIRSGPDLSDCATTEPRLSPDHPDLATLSLRLSPDFSSRGEFPDCRVQRSMVG